MTIPPVTEFGEVSPCQRIAEKYGVDWAVPLHIVHLYVHQEYLPNSEVVLTVPLEMRDDLAADCRRVADRTIAQHLLAEQRYITGVLTCIDGTWDVRS